MYFAKHNRVVGILKRTKQISTYFHKHQQEVKHEIQKFIIFIPKDLA